MSDEYLSSTGFEEFQVGGYASQVYENPQEMLSNVQKEKIVEGAKKVLDHTMDTSELSDGDISRYLFGKANRGRVLYLYEKEESLIGYMSCNLLNFDGELLKYNGSTVFHVSSAHILPSEQGNLLWKPTLINYLNRLPSDIQPRYAEGFTQSPRILKFMTLLSKGRIYPNIADSGHLSDLSELQNFVLPKIVGKKGTSEIANGCVVKGMSKRVYPEKESAGVTYDDFFYKSLGVNVDNGDFLHFVFDIPANYYKS